MPDRTPVIEVTSARKVYGATVAVDALTFHVERGEMFGVIGPDGAGKTSVLRLICGLIRPDGGTVRVLGVDPFRAHKTATTSIGYLSQRFSLYGDLTIDENIEFFARIHGVNDFAARRTRLLELTGLERFRGRLADRLSGGMRQKLALACTLVHEPPLLVLDEPTTGVDPVSRREFWKLLAEFLAAGLTIILATPYLDEAERCGRIALLDGGRLLAQDEPARLQASMTGVILEVVTTPARRALAVVRAHVGGDRAQLFGDRLHVRVAAASDAAAIADLLSREGMPPASIRAVAPTLEDVFIERVTRSHPPPPEQERGLPS